MSDPPQSDQPQFAPGSPHALVSRIELIERRLDQMELSAATPEPIRTSRLSIVDSAGHDRLVAELVGDVLELRIELPSSRPGQRTALLLFAAESPQHDDLPSGMGLQLWADGNVVGELTWWEGDG